MEIMDDPVILPDGHTYERTAIELALSLNPHSPLTREPMTMHNAKPNYALKSLIDNWRVHNQPPNPLQPVPIVVDPIKLDKFTSNYMADPENPNFSYLHVAIQPAQMSNRRPLSLFALIDVSGSMECNACESVVGLEDLNLSRLQLVKHALKTIVATLSEQDEICLITFSGNATLRLPSTKMTDIGKIRANDAIDGMIEEGATNIWDALRLGIQEARKIIDPEMITSLLLFTDGEPNRNPPMGIITALESVLADHQDNFTISAFGFGYNIDSPLMENIAKLGKGVYGYCPDCTMVGTVFINYMAGLLSTLDQNARLSIQTQNSTISQQLSLPNGGSRNILVRLPSIEVQQAKVTLFVSGRTFSHDSVTDVGSNNSQLVDQIYRNKLMKLISENLTKPLAETQSNVQALFDEISGIMMRTPFLQNILIDLIHDDPNHGQVERAFRPIYFAKWGIHYLRSLLRSHTLEQCGNFKDQSLQLYAHSGFIEMQTNAGKLFINLPPPQQQQQQGSYSGHGNYGNTYTYNSGPQAPVSMSRMYSASIGCIGGDCWVELTNGRKMMRDLRKGDRLIDGGIIECVVETIVPPGEISDLCVIGYAVLTPYHPIEVEEQWIFPCTLAPIIKAEIGSWFNLIVQGNKVVRVEGMKAITLGHGMTEGVLAHPYFGTNAVIDALRKYPGYTEGYIRPMKPVNVIRNVEGMIINAF
jgi:Mg-chelatase subunit ChlD